MNASTPETETYDKTVTQKPASEVPRFAPKETPKPPAGDIDTSTEELAELPESSQEAQLTFGPTLAFQLNLEGREESNQAGQIFLGLAAGAPQTNPTYLLSFLINIGSDGRHEGLSLSGLEIGKSYTAYIKGTAQIATASAFTVKPAFNNLGTLKLLSGDLNEDNVINSADFAIAKNALGSNPNSSNWNTNVDINKDNVINIFDIAFIVKNLNQTGAGGSWGSTPPTKTATSSASLRTNRPVGSSHCHPGEATTSKGGSLQNDSNCVSSFGSIGVDLDSVVIQTPKPTPKPTPSTQSQKYRPQQSDSIVVPAEDGDWVFLPKN